MVRRPGRPAAVELPDVVAVGQVADDCGEALLGAVPQQRAFDPAAEPLTPTFVSSAASAAAMSAWTSTWFGELRGCPAVP